MKITVTNFDERRTPDLHSQQTIVLSEGKLSRRTFTRLLPRDRHTGRPHHESLKIETWRKRRTACEVDEAHTVTLQGEEVQTLLDFVGGARSLPASGGSARTSRTYRPTTAAEPWWALQSTS